MPMPATLREFKPPSMRMVAREAMLARLADLAVGTRLPPLKTLAQELGIGRITLLAVIRELAGEGLVVSRPKLGTFVARRTKPSGSRGVSSAPAVMLSAAPLAGKRVGLVIDQHGQPMLLAMLRAAERELAGSGAHLVERSLESREPLVFDLCLVFNPALMAIESLPYRGPIVVVSTSWHESFVPKSRWDVVGVDQQGGARLVGEQFARAGFRSACFIGVRRKDGVWHPASVLRLRGLQEGLGASVAPMHQLNAEGYSFVAGGRGFRRYLELPRRPKAVFAASDEIAMGFLAAAEAQGLRVRRDFHLVGFDGQNMRHEELGPPLSTVAVPAEAMGRLAAEIATQRLLQPQRPAQTTYLRCSWHRGGTLGKASST
jgi:hypothetical protein